ncbi:MAG: hypothetical protein K2F92_01850 [Alistipes sp.]|nr:hypothetical protein [Alistipes sp.]
MKTKLLYVALTLTAICCLSSCSQKVYRLRGNYDVVTSIETNSSFEDVWNRVIDFFAENNIPIATLEKASGIVVANSVNIPESRISIEDEQGRILDRNAWFVFPYEKKFVRGKVQCSFNIRVRKQENGKSYISVNLGGISGYKSISVFNPVNLTTNIIEQAAPCYSTGKFEEDLLNLFK